MFNCFGTVTENDYRHSPTWEYFSPAATDNWLTNSNEQKACSNNEKLFTRCGSHNQTKPFPVSCTLFQNTRALSISNTGYWLPANETQFRSAEEQPTSRQAGSSLK